MLEICRTNSINRPTETSGRRCSVPGMRQTDEDYLILSPCVRLSLSPSVRLRVSLSLNISVILSSSLHQHLQLIVLCQIPFSSASGMVTNSSGRTRAPNDRVAMGFARCPVDGPAVRLPAAPLPQQVPVFVPFAAVFVLFQQHFAHEQHTTREPEPGTI